MKKIIAEPTPVPIGPPLVELSAPAKYYFANSPISYYRVDYQWYLRNTGVDSPLYWRPTDTLQSRDSGSTYDTKFASPLPCAKIGLIDTGVRLNHPEFAGVSFTGWNFNGQDTADLSDASVDSHGTSIAGVLLSRGDRIQGITKASELVIAKVTFDRNWQAVNALHYCADQGCRVINFSWSTGINDASLKEAFEYATNKGSIVVIATQNVEQDVDITPDYPSSWNIPNIVSVTSVTRAGVHYNPSALGKNTIHLAAPGRVICTTGNNEDYVYTSGTSLAAPFVTGTLAMMATKFPTLSNNELIAKMLAACDKEPSVANTISGGRLNIRKALYGF